MAAAATARGDPVQAVEARAPRARAAGVGREGEGAGCVRSGRQRREERLGLVNERCRFFTVLRHPRRLLPL